MRKFVVLVSLLSGLVLAAPALANAPATIVRFPVAGDAFPNACTGETVTLTDGFFQIVSHITADGAGGFHVIVEGEAQGVSGTSDGTAYRVAGGFWFETNLGPDRGTNETVTDVLNLISQGSGDNFALDTAFHVTLDANGTPTAFVFNTADGTCRG